MRSIEKGGLQKRTLVGRPKLHAIVAGGTDEHRIDTVYLQCSVLEADA